MKQKVSRWGQNREKYEKPLCYICKHCGKMFLAVGRYQKDIMEKLYEGEIVISDTRREYYPYGKSDSERILEYVSAGKRVECAYSFGSLLRTLVDYRDICYKEEGS